MFYWNELLAMIKLMQINEQNRMLAFPVAVRIKRCKPTLFVVLDRRFFGIHNKKTATGIGHDILHHVSDSPLNQRPAIVKFLEALMNGQARDLHGG